MTVVHYNPKKHKQIIRSAVMALKAGKLVAFPTDTSYGLACDVENYRALKNLYLAKERKFSKPVHIIPPSLAYVKKVVAWSKSAQKLAKAFWPGALTLVLPLSSKKANLKILTAKTGNLGIRFPENKIALDLAKGLGRPITATSANPSAHLSGGYDSYSARDVVKQFSKQKHKPDIIIDVGRLRKNKPSTVFFMVGNETKILRKGPISLKQITKILK